MEVRPYKKNAKKHPEKQIKQIAESIKRFGFRQPLVIKSDGELIVGHGRLEAAKLLGITELKEAGQAKKGDNFIPYLLADDLTEQEIKAYRLADNKLNESDWDMELVIEELKDLDDGLIELSGFDKDLIIDSDEKDDEVPEVPDEPKTKLGDIYQLGNHRVMCGDSTKKEDVERLMDGKKADMVFTDPPYNINYKGQGKNTSNTILADNVLDDEFDKFLDNVFENYRSHAKGGAGTYVFHASRTQAQFEKAMHKNGYEIKNQLIWNKPMSALGWGNYRWKHEPFFYAGQKNNELKFYGDRTHSTVWDFQKTEQELLRWAKNQKASEQRGKTTIWSMKRDNVHGYVHPTQKPVELITHAIKNSTKVDDIVMDLFLGSGSTLIACEKTNRVCYGMELDPRYISVILDRWSDYTGKDPVLKGTSDQNDQRKGLAWSVIKNSNQKVNS